MKNLLLIAALTASICCVGNGTPTDGDPWVDQYRARLAALSSTITDAQGEPIAFFNGLSVGASAGVGHFHGDLADYDIFAPFDDFDTYYKFGWRVYAAREIKWGLGAKLQFEKGSLAGGRLPGKQSLPVDFETQYSTLSAVATFDVFNTLFRKDDKLKNTKIYLYAEAGIGLSLYRSLSYWRAEDGRIRDYVGYTVTDENPPTQRYTADSKSSPAMALNIPVGFTFGYRVNYKTDVTFSYTLNNLMTDRFDTWDRDFSANDKYSYFGLGLRYNFNREKEDYPKKKKKKKSEEQTGDKNRKWRLFGSKKEDVSPNEVNLEDPIESRKSHPITPENEQDDLEEIRMKMFELQLKLFEMQYLLDGGSNPQEGSSGN